MESNHLIIHMLAAYLYKEAEAFLKAYPKSNYLEIGSFDGEGIASLCKKFPDRKFYSIDPFLEDGHTSHITKDFRGEFLSLIENKFKENTKTCKNLTHYKITTERFIDLYYKNLPDIDILAIDGDHSFYGVSTDLLLASIFSRKKPIIVLMDDIDKETVNRALSIFNDLHGILIKKTSCPDLIYFVLNK
jgi:hypothetical protein